MILNSLYKVVSASSLLLSPAVALPATSPDATAVTLSPQTALRILPLGDSITFGFNENPGNSYRRFLQCSLSTAGIPVSYIGSLANGDWTNNANEGYTGQQITPILTSASKILEQKPSPNVVLLHAGSNDILRNSDLANAPQRLSAMIDTIIEKTDAAVLVAKIIGFGTGNTQFNAPADTYNSAIEGIVAERTKKGLRVKVVDMHAVVTASDLSDGIHPKASGFKKMAQVWLDGLQGLAINNVTGDFVDLGRSAVPGSGNCADLAA
ncbi:hypothetical protein HYFRA_00002737 [Hymenoscyphus fraxineus]|uniref:SGNH hydrolase-type esterase domain-containing protein n=1 Tax=Hymenoscyphus fraxineus TaxID=746836 RepID=A0A9N9KMJ2_9HELO|nr:hypothetical protein HYFRA_00002737 [Hymenoscyphus fraxineus]